MSETPAINPSLLKKSAARLAAVQCLYSAVSSGKELQPERLAKDMQQLLSSDKEALKKLSASGFEPHYPTLNKLLTGAVTHLSEIDALIDSLEPKKSRHSPLLFAILRLGIYELRFSDALKPALVISEYTTIASQFFGEAETDFVHALLRKLDVGV